MEDEKLAADAKKAEEATKKADAKLAADAKKAEAKAKGVVELKKIDFEETHKIGNTQHYHFDLEKIPISAVVCCNQEIEVVEYSKVKNKNEVKIETLEKEFTPKFFDGIYDFNKTGYSDSLKITVLGYKLPIIEK
jgi:hypothetical protein